MKNFPVYFVINLLYGQVRAVQILGVGRDFKGSRRLGPVDLVPHRDVFSDLFERRRVGSLFVAPPRPGIGARVQVDFHLRVREDYRRHVPALDDRVGGAGYLPYDVVDDLPELGDRRQLGHEGVDLLGAQLGLGVRAVKVEPAGAIFDSRAPRGRYDRFGVPGIDAQSQRAEGHGAIDAPRVDVGEAEALGDPPRNRALAGSGGSVDGDYHVPFFPKA